MYRRICCWARKAPPLHAVQRQTSLLFHRSGFVLNQESATVNVVASFLWFSRLAVACS